MAAHLVVVSRVRYLVMVSVSGRLVMVSYVNPFSDRVLRQLAVRRPRTSVQFHYRPPQRSTVFLVKTVEERRQLDQH